MAKRKQANASGIDAILKRRKDRQSQQATLRAAAIERKRQQQRWSDAWLAMDDPSPTWRWSDESNANLHSLAAVVKEFDDIEVIERIATRITNWLNTDNPLLYSYPVAKLIIHGPKQDDYRIDCMEGMLACCKLLLAAGDGDGNLTAKLTQDSELIRPVHWGRLRDEVLLNADLPLEPELIGQRVAKCGSCQEEWPLADDHADAVLCPACNSLKSTPENDDRSGNNDIDAKRREAIKWWNDGATWSEVNSKLGRDKEAQKATVEELKRFARADGIDIRVGKAGRKKGTK